MNSFSITSPPAQLGYGSTVVPFNATIPPGLYQTYYFRAVANSIEGGTEKGAIRTFQTGVRYIAIGDSITAGSQDTIPSDGTGYEPVLGYRKLNNPYTVANEGVSGTTSADGAASIAGTLSSYPSPSAKYYLILYGTNDADIGSGVVTKAAYKANMQAIITAIKNAGKIPYLAKVPYVDPTNPSFPAGLSISDGAIQQYNQAIDELRTSNGISVVAPDYYTWFQSHTSQLDDGLHPDGTGYQSMANLWFNVLP
jgi:lysophospholipase L1-like esterase